MAKPPKRPPPVVVKVSRIKGLQFGPTKTPPGSRLKGAKPKGKPG